MAAKPFCKLCGSIDVVMDATGLFVCNDCGSRYTTEAMRDLVLANSSETDAPENDTLAAAEPSASDSEFLIDNLDESTGPLIEQYSNNEYELAAASWESLKSTEAASHPWIALIGLLSVSITTESSVSGLVEIAYSKFKRLCNSMCIDPETEVQMALAAIKECTDATSVIVDRQLNLLKRRQEGLASINEQLITPDRISSSLDSARLLALLQISSCIGRGYIPSNADWLKLKNSIEHMDPANRVPLVDTILKRITDIVANQRIPDLCRTPSNDANTSTGLLAVRKLWTSGDFDLACDHYQVLKGQGDDYISIEADTALNLFRYYVDDQATCISFYPGQMKEAVERSCIALMTFNDQRAVEFLLRIGQLSNLPLGLSSHYIRVADLCKESNPQKGIRLLKAGENYLQLAKGIISTAFESVQFILTNDDANFDIDSLRHIYDCLNSISNVVDKDAQSQLAQSLKHRFIDQIKDKPEYQEKLSSVLEASNSKIAEIDPLITKAEKALNEMPFYALSRRSHAEKVLNELQQEKARCLEHKKAAATKATDDLWESFISHQN